MGKSLVHRMEAIVKWFGFGSLASTVVVLAGAAAVTPWIAEHRQLVAMVARMEMRLLLLTVIALVIAVTYSAAEWGLQNRQIRNARALSRRVWDEYSGRFLYRPVGMLATDPEVAYQLVLREVFDCAAPKFLSAVCSQDESHGPLKHSREPSGVDEGLCCLYCNMTYAREQAGAVESSALALFGNRIRLKYDRTT